MIYIRVKWNHKLSDEPVLLYSELDGQRWEVRKVEVYRDGRKGFATAGSSLLGTKLGKEQIPLLDEIASDPQFEPLEITRDEFEQIWATRLIVER